MRWSELEPRREMPSSAKMQTPDFREKSHSRKEVGWARLELATNALKGRCSTIELPTPGKERC
jgi:hypothetical protein